LFRPPARWSFSIYHLFSTPGEIGLAFFLTAVVYLMLIVGWHTKIAQILSFICVTSLHSRNIMLENGGDVVMNIVACSSMFLPLGRRFSIDALRASWRAADEHTPAALNDRTHPPPPTIAPVVSLAVFVFIVQFAVIYAFNGGN